ncbi:methyltransferase domin containing protein [Candidatus Nitrosoglobus terrae]|uniref:Methyltransferase domin containing protein n=1 Tax=Candidatus Nitrosoglobus terrae TaxID=1630141 RepID=A0A1Q2SNX3_9GAMM|nr:class I SAM-dependent methyltransferase [Candidatus Nitrosoglobus terrae]BAW80834.1 methyltransferase domin containing protein [Candidatus Nitrosoglobus terrae]
MCAGQVWDLQNYRKNAQFVPDLGMPVIAWLNPKIDEHILDLGCGDGTLTAKLAAFGCHVVGVDSSPEFINAVRAQGLEARLMDGEYLQFSAEFDAVFSNAALHWMKQPRAVAEGVWKALIPGGRFVGELGGEGNIQTIVTALYQVLTRYRADPSTFNPWYFPSIEEYQRLLESIGFQLIRIELFQRPTLLSTDMSQWLWTFGQCFIADVPKLEQPEFIAEVCDKLRPKLCRSDNSWIVDYVRLRFEARKPY